MKLVEKYWILALVFLLSLQSVYAQDIEGVKLGTIVDKEFIREHFGDDGVYCQVTYGLWKSISNAYVFGVDTLLVDNHNRLNHISLHSPRFAVDVNDVPGGIRVGRKVDSVVDERFGYLELRYTNPDKRTDQLMRINSDFDENSFYAVDSIISNITIYGWLGDDVEGIGYWEKTSYDILIKKLGVPDVVKETYFYEEPAYEYIYHDGELESIFIISKQYRLLDYHIRSPRFRTFVETIPGGLRVGDKVEKASAMFNPDGSYKEPVDCHPVLGVKNGVIKSIYYYAPD